MRPQLLLAATLLLFAGCAPVISEQSLRLVDRSLSFAELRQDPLRYRGRHLLLGGAIVAVRNTDQGGELEVVQFRTDDSGEIEDTANSGGRFLARSSAFLDPAIYGPGLLVTIVGEVQGSLRRPLGEIDYNYPLLSIREIHLWKPGEGPSSPVFHFGIGIGTVIR